jgi:tol-pal system protein YbgF
MQPQISLRGPCSALLVISLATVLCRPAHAGLFDDEEARKAILDLRARIAAVEDQGKVRTSEVAGANAQLLEQITALRRSMLDLNNQLEAARAEIAKLRGSDEQLARDLSEVQRRQRDIGQAMDDRLRKLEPVKVTIEGREFVVDPDEKKAFEDAVSTLRSGEFDKSITQLGNFQRRYAGSPYTDLSRFWLGNAQYGKRDYKEAISSFRAFVASAPEHPKAPEALLAVANSQAEMKDPKAARKTIDELMKAYPQSEAALAGKERLASIK